MKINKKLLINRKLFYMLSKDDFIIECFKLLDVDETINDAYQIIATNATDGNSDLVTTNTPQGAIALADTIMSNLNNQS